MSPDVLVIGGGVSGLCAAVECAARGHSVVLAEQHHHLGGRVYSFLHQPTGEDVDNGQHLLLGCYHSTLRYLHTVGTIDLLTLQSSLEISFRSPSRRFLLRAPMLPSPLHVFGALLRLASLSWPERLSILRIVPALLKAHPETDHELEAMTVDEWLTRHGQRRSVKTNLWNILSIGTLNERPEKASAAMFVKVLQTVFLGQRSDASIALPRKGLSRLFADGGMAYLASHGGRVLLDTRVSEISVKNHMVESVKLGDTRISPRIVVSAVPYHAISAMFADTSTDSLPLVEKSQTLSPVPIVSIHLWYDTHFMQEEFTALLGSPIDWVFNKSMTSSMGNRGSGTQGKPISNAMYLSLVISAARLQAGQSKAEIVTMAETELRRYFPGAAKATLVHSLVIKEKRATFSPSPGSGSVRPPHATPVRNLFLAGDWTDTKLPSTIEGAAQSGYACAALADALLRRMLQGEE